jgi:alkanesulfonate monooxygenase SsuD/methylene tetrahydromethanopterin reductase-like flavin-dependent oxidoreductase (luciferase family)
MSAPETFLAYLAGRTTRIGLGHGVVCLPPLMNHPVKVAERIATLDILSGGRVHFGMGKGATQQEAGTFGYELEALPPMIDEAMRLIPRFFVEEVVEHHGEFIDVPPRPVHPKPLQDPHPPLYQACTNTATLVDAGGRGIGALVLGFGGPDEVAAKNDVYRAAFPSPIRIPGSTALPPPATAPRSSRPGSVPRWCPSTSLIRECRCSTPTTPTAPWTIASGTSSGSSRQALTRSCS